MVNIIGIIAEYNPFHNGHLHQLNFVKETFPNACIIIILNGCFLQRGEPAILSIEERATLAIDYGADLILELPFAFGTQRADIFASGAIQILTAFQCDILVYGAEQPLPEIITSIEALQPNQKLAYFYHKAIEQQQSPIIPFPIQRIHSTYLEKKPIHTSITSATAIRHMYKDGQYKKMTAYLPENSLQMLKKDNPHHPTLTDYFPFLQALLIHTIKKTALTQNGTYQNIMKSLSQANCFEAFFNKAHKKHMSKTHLQRTLTYLLCGIDQKLLDNATQTIWTKIILASDAGLLYFKKQKKLIKEQIHIIQKTNELPKEHQIIQEKAMIAYALLTKQSPTTLLQDYNKRKAINRKNMK